MLLVIAAFVAVIVVGALTSPAALVVAIVTTLLAGLGVAVLAAWLGTKLSIVPSIIVLERAGIGTAVRRSWRLTNGYFWRTLGTLLLVALILNVAAQVVVQPISFIGTILAVLIDPTGTGSGLTVTIITTVVTAHPLARDRRDHVGGTGGTGRRHLRRPPHAPRGSRPRTGAHRRTA